MNMASYYNVEDDKKVKCILCPHNCKIENNQSGFCRVRKNIDGRLYSLNYGKISALNIDPIEKKPLFHFYPGSKILSIGSLGCNLKCSYCQNYEISQLNGHNCLNYKEIDYVEIAEEAVKLKGNIGVAYTYNEPTIFWEYMKDCAKMVKNRKKVNIMVSNGYINQRPLEESFEFIDAYSIDLKFFRDKSYREVAKGNLEPVKSSLKMIRDKGKHLEIENLIVPTLNDSIDEFTDMVKWISELLGENTILHINRYYPAYLMKIEPASEGKFKELYEIAKKYLHFVYVGNIDVDYGKDTYCNKCGSKIIERNGYRVEIVGSKNSGKCENCGEKIFIV